eukprot:13112521-Heterocapsa_arctica.AAC.1
MVHIGTRARGTHRLSAVSALAVQDTAGPADRDVVIDVGPFYLDDNPVDDKLVIDSKIDEP